MSIMSRVKKLFQVNNVDNTKKVWQLPSGFGIECDSHQSVRRGIIYFMVPVEEWQRELLAKKVKKAVRGISWAKAYHYELEFVVAKMFDFKETCHEVLWYLDSLIKTKYSSCDSEEHF